MAHNHRSFADYVLTSPREHTTVKKVHSTRLPRALWPEEEDLRNVFSTNCVLFLTKHLGKFWRNMFFFWLVLSWVILLFNEENITIFYITKLRKKTLELKWSLLWVFPLLTHPHFLASLEVPQSENHSLKLRMNSQIGFFSNQISLSFFSHLFMFSWAFLYITYKAINRELHHLPPSTHKRRIKWLVSNSTSFWLEVAIMRIKKNTMKCTLNFIVTLYIVKEETHIISYHVFETLACLKPKTSKDVIFSLITSQSTTLWK
jgi:hypothetical protein